MKLEIKFKGGGSEIVETNIGLAEWHKLHNTDQVELLDGLKSTNKEIRSWGWEYGQPKFAIGNTVGFVHHEFGIRGQVTRRHLNNEKGCCEYQIHVHPDHQHRYSLPEYVLREEEELYSVTTN